MLTIQQIKADPQDAIRRLAIKGFKGEEAINKVLELDKIGRASCRERV